MSEREPVKGQDPVYDALINLTEKYGIALYEEKFPNSSTGGIYHHSHKYGVELHIILINNRSCLQKKIFALAHELAHFKLHQEAMEKIRIRQLRIAEKRGKEPPLFCSTPKMEDEANEFANRLVSFLNKRLATKIKKSA